jgi:hypothetical protein
MTPINYFKLQAKNLFRDFKTQHSVFDPEMQVHSYEYEPEYFDIIGILLYHEFDEDNFKLMNAQHLIAKFAGFDKWATLQKASSFELDLAKMLFDSMHKIHAEEWHWYLSNQESENQVVFDSETRLEIFTEIFYKVDGHESYFPDFRLIRLDLLPTPPEETKRKLKTKTRKVAVKISSLPLNRGDREKFIKAANQSFERIFERIEPDNPELTRALWNAEHYIDEELLSPDMLPIDCDYALSLVDSFLVGYVIQLAAQADDRAVNLN